MRYFAALREAAGREGEPLDLPPNATVGVVRALLAARYSPMAPVLSRSAAAVNRAFVTDETALREGDELVFIPPVGGG
jgi:molybdopterin synthase sulfur carrier subunit